MILERRVEAGGQSWEMISSYEDIKSATVLVSFDTACHILSLRCSIFFSLAGLSQQFIHEAYEYT